MTGAGPRTASPAAGAALVARLSFPTAATFDEAGTMYVAESGLPFGGAPPGGRVWRIADGGSPDLLAEDLAPPVTGLVHHGGYLYVSEGGSGRISRFRPGEPPSAVVEGLPGPGNYHTNMVVFGPDGKLYFSQGAMSNMGIIGLDSYELGWLQRLPHAHDIPGYDIVLAGTNVTTPNPLSPDADAVAETGGFVPFGTTTTPGQRVPAQTPCTAAVMRCNPDGTALELVAWGLRNAFSLGFLPDGRLLAIDQGPDDRGSRPVGNAPDLLYEVRDGAWYGWPDFIGGDPVTDAAYRPQRGDPPSFLLANHDELPPPERPLVRFAPHASAVKFDVAPRHCQGVAGHLFVALFGDEAPMTAPAGPRVGRAVVRINPSDWREHPALAGVPVARPIDVRFHPTRDELYVVDFGHFEMDAERGVIAKPGSGGVWRVSAAQL